MAQVEANSGDEQRILVTGASGTMGRALRPLLARAGRTLRLTSRSPLAPASEGESIETVIADLTDLDAMVAAADGCDAILHLGGQATESDWEHILDANIHGTRQVLEAARLTGVRRVILASSNHAAGMYERAAAPVGGLPADAPARPDSYYGFSKAAIEHLGRLYAERHGMDVISLRIGTFAERPAAERTLATWLSPGDATRLVEACLTAPAGGYRDVWGISANTRAWWSLAEGAAIGYVPVDDAERFADEIPDATPSDLLDLERAGGAFTRAPVGATSDAVGPEPTPAPRAQHAAAEESR